MIKTKLIVTFLLFNSLSAAATVNKLQRSEKSSLLKKTLSSFVFNYFVQYNGPSLDPSYQEGATYNRFDGGRDLNDGSRYDTTGSTQIFQSFRLGYKLPKNMILSYGITYQDNVNKDINYKYSDGSSSPTPRNYGRSFNNHRIALWTPSLYDSQFINFSLSSFYELPTTVASQEEDRLYGLGLQPTLVIKSNIAGLNHGFRASFERNFFKDDERTSDQQWCQKPGFTCDGVDQNKKTVSLITLASYLNYRFTDKLEFTSSVEFDWAEVGTDRDLGNNLDNVGNIGINIYAARNLSFGVGLIFSLDDLSTNKTAQILNMNISI
jgi:hypothetical protein